MKTAFHLSASCLALILGTGAALAGTSPVQIAFDPTVAPTAAERPAEQLDFRSLPAADGEWTFRGETDTRIFPVYLSGSEALHARSFTAKITDSAISALPERSRILVTVNGSQIANLSFQEIGQDGTINVPVTSGMLSTGFNAVKISVLHRHRVDCTIPGTYELWTRIDPRKTGFELAKGAMDVATPDGVTASLQSTGLPQDVSIVVPPGSGTGFIESASEVAQNLIIAGWGWMPTIKVVNDASTAEGAVIEFSSAGDAGRPASGEALARNISLQPALAGGPGRITVAVDADGGLKGALAAAKTLASARNLNGTPEGVRALASRFGMPISDETQYSLRDFNLDTQRFAGHLFRTDLPISLPWDFYAADYGAAKLTLRLAHAGDLQDDAGLLVRVNGVPAVSIPINKNGQKELKEFDIEVPLSRFHPGRNVVQIEADLPTHADAVCDPAVDDTGYRLVLSNDSTIEFPSLARIGSLPDLSATLANGYPYVAKGQSLPVYMPDAGIASVGVAATVVARMAANNGAAIPADYHFTEPANPTGSGLLVGPVNRLPQWARDITVESAYLSKTEDLTTLKPDGNSNTQPDARPLQAAVKTDAQGPTNNALLNALRGQPGNVTPDDQTSQAADLIGEARSFAENAHQWLRSGDWKDKLEDIRTGVMGRASDIMGLTAQGRAAPAAGGDLMIAQTASLPEGVKPFAALGNSAIRPDAWTVVTAESNSALAAGYDALPPEKVHGPFVIARADHITVEAFKAPDSVIISTQPLSLSNARLAIAGWLSNNPYRYLQIVLLTLIIVASTSFVAVTMRGKRSDK